LKNVYGESKSAWRFHTHFDVDRLVPTRIDVTGGKNSGKNDEKSVLRTRLAADHCYVMDRWFAEFQLFNDIHAAGSGYVCRLRGNSRYNVLDARPLSDEALAADVLSDAMVQLGAGSPQSKGLAHPVRLVQVRTAPSRPGGKSPGGKTGPPSDGVLRVAMDLLDVPPKSSRRFTGNGGRSNCFSPF